MKRKKFLRTTLSAAVMPWLINGLPLRAFGKGSLFESELVTSPKSDRVLVLIQLDGGNDGLSTVIPLDQYKNLTAARTNIIIPEDKVLALKGTSITGVHPSMREVQNLYNNNQVTFIQGVSYPNPNYSHFRATDIWLTGSDSRTELNTGWIGRILDSEYPNFPIGYPNNIMPDPPAIQIGSVLSKAFQGASVGMGMAVGSTTDFYNFVLDNCDDQPKTPAGDVLGFIRMSAHETQLYSAVIKTAANAQKNLSTMYPPNGVNTLADQLRIAAQLIGGGLRTKVYMVTIDGFDTHGAQVAPSDPLHGKHANLLAKFSEAIAAFQDDLQLMGKQDKVVGMAFSEFGRRIKSNNSYGTDHGSSGPVILFGAPLKGGLIGNNPVIGATVEVNDNLDMQYDFRSVYASILKGWFGITDSGIKATGLGSHPILDLFKS